MRGAVTAVKKLNRSRICEANVTGRATLAPIVEMTPLATIAAMEQEVARMNKAQRVGITTAAIHGSLAGSDDCDSRRRASPAKHSKVPTRTEAYRLLLK
jgi:hypothetical protein